MFNKGKRDCYNYELKQSKKQFIRTLPTVRSAGQKSMTRKARSFPI